MHSAAPVQHGNRHPRSNLGSVAPTRASSRALLRRSASPRSTKTSIKASHTRPKARRGTPNENSGNLRRTWRTVWYVWYKVTRHKIQDTPTHDFQSRLPSKPAGRTQRKWRLLLFLERSDASLSVFSLPSQSSRKILNNRPTGRATLIIYSIRKVYMYLCIYVRRTSSINSSMYHHEQGGVHETSLTDYGKNKSGTAPVRTKMAKKKVCFQEKWKVWTATNREPWKWRYYLIQGMGHYHPLPEQTSKQSYHMINLIPQTARISRANGACMCERERCIPVSSARGGPGK